MNYDFDYIWLEDFADEISPCEPKLESWQKWLSEPNDWATDPARAGDVFKAATLTLTGWCQYTRKDVDGKTHWQPLSELPAGDPWALVEGDGDAFWMSEDLLTNDIDTSIADKIFFFDADIGDTVWVLFGEFDQSVVATYHGAGSPMTLAQRVTQ